MIGLCGAAGCISADEVAALFGAVMGLWALGFGLGKSVAWTRALRSAA